MKKLFLLLSIPFFVVSCNAQSGEKRMAEPSSGQDSIQPKVDVRVNKQYDENGNLIAYDSVYFWSYTNKTGEPVEVDIDSVLSQFKPMIDMRFPDFFDHHQNDFFGDSLFYHGFLAPDYFMDRWQHDMMQMNRMMREMDSLKQLFFREQYPELPNRAGDSKTL